MGEEFVGSGWAFPLRADPTGKVALVGGTQEIEESIRLILMTAPGERPMRPEFGCAVHDYVFDGIDPEMMGRVDHAVRVAIDRWEPRVEVDAVDFDIEGEDVIHIEVTYRLKPNNDVRNLIYPLYVVPAEDAP
jgi:uncharacterized protein